MLRISSQDAMNSYLVVGSKQDHCSLDSIEGDGFNNFELSKNGDGFLMTIVNCAKILTLIAWRDAWTVKFT